MDIDFKVILDWCVIKPIGYFLAWSAYKTLIFSTGKLVFWKHSGDRILIEHAIEAIQKDKSAYRTALLKEIQKITPDPVETLSIETLQLICTELLKRWDHGNDFNPKEKDNIRLTINKQNPGIPLVSKTSFGSKYKGTVQALLEPELRTLPERTRDLFIAIILNDDITISACITDLKRLVSTGGCWMLTIDDLCETISEIWQGTRKRGRPSFSDNYINDNRKASRRLLSPILYELNKSTEKFRSEVNSKIHEVSSIPTTELDDNALGKICSIIGHQMAGSLNHGDAALAIGTLYYYVFKHDTEATNKTIKWIEELITPPKIKG